MTSQAEATASATPTTSVAPSSSGGSLDASHVAVVELAKDASAKDASDKKAEAEARLLRELGTMKMDTIGALVPSDAGRSTAADARAPRGH